MTSTDHIDQPTTIRKGEELDLAKLTTYLRDHLPDLGDHLKITQFPGGHSNLTYSIRGKGEQEYVLRRPPFGKKIKSAHDMGREYRILSGLHKVYDRVPVPMLHCEDESVIGAPFYVMTRLQGIVLRKQPPKGLDLGPAIMSKLSRSFVDNFVMIHAADMDAAGLSDLGKPEGYVSRQITGWTKRYQNAKTDDIPAIDRVAGWLNDNMPPESGAGLIHNDYKYDNLVLNPDDLTEIVGVLDWEMATLGDPLMDLGSTLGYWVDPDDPPFLKAAAFGLTAMPGNFNRRELAEHYAQESGRSFTDKELVFYYVYGLFKLCVIAQQIYARFKAGASTDARFAAMIEAVKVLSQVGTIAIDKNRIDGLG